MIACRDHLLHALDGVLIRALPTGILVARIVEHLAILLHEGLLEVAQARETKNPEAGLWTIDYTVVKQDGTEVMTFSSSFLIKCR